MQKKWSTPNLNIMSELKDSYSKFVESQTQVQEKLFICELCSGFDLYTKSDSLQSSRNLA